MAIQQRTTRLKLDDDGIKAIGVQIIAGTLASQDGLVEGVDYEIVDLAAGTIRRLHENLEAGRLYVFTCDYDDGS